MLPLRLVIDTNVVISAALKPEGLERYLIFWRLQSPRAFTYPSLSWTNTPKSFPVRNSKSARASAGNCSSSSETGVTWSYLRGVLKCRTIPMTIGSWNAPMPPAPITWSRAV
jgi:hypothetical protein